MRIASVIRPESVNANYRARIPLVGLESRGHQYQLFDAHTWPDWDQISSYDVVHFCRIWEEPYQKLAEALRAAGVGITWDCDDNLPAIEKETASWRIVGGFRGVQVAKDMQAMMKLSDVVTTTTDVLKRQFEATADDVRRIENYLAPPMIVGLRPPRINPNLRIGWIAGLEHRADAEKLGLAEMLMRILDRYPRVEVITLGLGLGLQSDRYHHIPPIDLLGISEVACQFDIALAPLTDSAFNRSRSNIKVKEYAAVGAPWLASDLEPYEGLGEPHGGKVISNNAWEQEIAALIEDAEHRERLALLGRAWGRRQDIMRNLDGWESAFEDAAAKARLRGGAPSPAFRP